VGLAISATSFPCTTKLGIALNRWSGITLHWRLHPEESQQHAWLSQFALQYKDETLIFPHSVISNNPWQLGSFNVTCSTVSKSVSGAGLTSVMSWAAAEVMSDPADRMAGCMRGASVSRLNVESAEGKVKELAVTAASICSTDDCMILARAFNSAKVFGRALPSSEEDTVSHPKKQT